MQRKSNFDVNVKLTNEQTDGQKILYSARLYAGVIKRRPAWNPNILRTEHRTLLIYSGHE